MLEHEESLLDVRLQRLLTIFLIAFLNIANYILTGTDYQ